MKIEDVFVKPHEETGSLRLPLRVRDVEPEPNYRAFEQLLDEIKLMLPGIFEPNVWYNEPGDLLEVTVAPDDYYVIPLQNGIDVCISFASGQMVGVKVWGISRKLAKAEG